MKTAQNDRSERFPPSPFYFDRRFANGAVAVETPANRLKLTLTPEINFAIGGATTGRSNTFLLLAYRLSTLQYTADVGEKS